MSKIYIDLNRNNAQIKNSDKTNQWGTILPDTIRIPAGSQIRINNTSINYKGLNGQSIEINKDEIISFSLAYYLSHSDFLIPVNDFNNTNITENNFYTASGLNTIDLDCLVEVNYQYLMSSNLWSELSQARQIELKNGSYYGRTEQPLMAVWINSDGFMEPYIDNVEIPIQAGIYSINSLSGIINDNLNGTRIYLGNDNYKSSEQIKYENNNSDYKGIDSKILKRVNAWEYSYSLNGTNYNVFSTLILSNDATPNFMYQQTYINKCLIYTTNDSFIKIVNDCKNINRDPSFNWTSWRNSNYIAGIKKLWQPTTGGIRAMSNGEYVFQTNAPDVFIDYVEFNTQDADYLPLDYGYYLGSSDFLFNFDVDKNAFNLQFMHSPRRMPSYDRIGGLNDSGGKICSFIKKDVCLIDKLKLVDNITDTNLIQTISNSIYQPRARNGGFIIFNFDLGISKKYKTNNYYEENKYNYMTFRDFFNNDNEARLAWENSILFQLGFSYNQLNDNNYYDKIISYDLSSILYGRTTNNSIDTTTQNSLATLYCPEQSPTAQDTVNPDPSGDTQGIPYTIENQVKYFDLQNTNRNMYGIGFTNYKNWKYVIYHQAQCFPILTSSTSIEAVNLPTLSKIPYFVITSDIFSGGDFIKYSTLPILALINKSNMSNQDYISSFTDITHITQKDIVINSVNIFVFNSDLTEPKLGTNSSVMLEITPYIAPPIEKK